MFKKKILMIDDEPEFAEMTQILLEANSFEVVVANDGLAGIQKAQTERPHLILLDLVMPAPGGFEVLRRLQADETTKYTPVVMLTSKRESKNIFKAQELRATDYLMKPCSASELLEVVRKHA
jgi:DNA-binding response OmpR family regulator